MLHNYTSDILTHSGYSEGSALVTEKTEPIKKGNRKASHCKLVTEGAFVPKQEDMNEI